MNIHVEATVFPRNGGGGGLVSAHIETMSLYRVSVS